MSAGTRYLGGVSKSPARLGELGIWLAALMACAVGPKPMPSGGSSLSPSGLALDQNGCLKAPPGLLARWEGQSSDCGPVLVRDRTYPQRIGLLAGHSGATLAEGLSPKACKGKNCAFLSHRTPLGPVVIAALNHGSPEHASRYWIGLRYGDQFSFVSLTPGDVQAEAGEPVAPSVMLEPWRCGQDLALRREARATGERALELAQREGRYLPDGHGWLVVPKVDWDSGNCERLALTF